MTDDTDQSTIDGQIEIDPERVAWMLRLNDSLDPREGNRRVVKIWNGTKGWTAEIVRKQRSRRRYPNTNPSFFEPFSFLDTDDESYYRGPPQQRYTPDDATEEEHQQIVDDWEDDVIEAVGGTISVGSPLSDDDPTVLRVVPESDD